LGPYTLQDTLGAGSMGTVYRALSRNSSGLFAVKVLPRRSMWNIRLARRKVKDFETFDHPAVVPFVDVGTAGGMHYLVWPFVEGQTLDAYIKELGPLPASEAASYIRQAAEGLAICQEHDLIHGLLKPSNLLLSSDRQVRILDFGVGALLAQTESESVVDTMSTANTMASGLDCASPEGIMDPTAIGPASDQYSLGCVLYFLLTGQFPFPGDNAVEKMMAHQTKQPAPVQELTATVPDGLAKVLDRLLQKQPQNRYPSMLDLVSALRPFAQESTAAAMPWKAPGSRPVQPLPAPPRQSGAMPALRMSDDRLTAHAQPPIVPPSRPAPPLSAARPAPPS
jgi:serine/threonine-protein kinase